MTEIVFLEIIRKKNNKIIRISYFFPTHFLVHRKVRCPPKVPPNPTSINIYNIYIYNILIYILEKNKFLAQLGTNLDFFKKWKTRYSNFDKLLG